MHADFPPANSWTPALAAAQSSNGPGGKKIIKVYIYIIYIYITNVG
jgi:hypothetical protein